MEKENEFNKNLKLIFKSSLIVFIALFISKILTYLYRIIIARYYGPEIYGIFSLAIMILGWFVAFSSLGFAEGILRYIPWYKGKKQENKIKYLIKFSTTILLISGIFSGIILFFLSEFIALNLFHSQELIIFLKIFSFLIPIYIFANVFLGIIQAFEKIAWHSFILNILQNVVKLLALLIFIFLGLKTNAIIFSFFIGILVTFIIAYFVSKYELSKILKEKLLDKKSKLETKNEFFAYSWPFIFIGMIGTILVWTDTFFIGYFKGAFEVGLYHAAIPLAVLMRFIPELFLKLFSPLITREISKQKFNEVKNLSQQVGKWIFILNLPIFLILFLFPGAILNILFGEEYLLAETALRILVAGSFLISFIFISESILSSIGKSKLIMWNLIAVSVLNIILNIFMIPKYGINGAALSTTISNTIMATLIFFQTKHYTSIVPLRRKMARIFWVSLIPLTIILLVKESLPQSSISFFLLTTFFILSYFLLIIITGCLDKNDFMILRSFKRKIFRVNAS